MWKNPLFLIYFLFHTFLVNIENSYHNFLRTVQARTCIVVYISTMCCCIVGLRIGLIAFICPFICLCFCLFSVNLRRSKLRNYSELPYLSYVMLPWFETRAHCLFSSFIYSFLFLFHINKFCVRGFFRSCPARILKYSMHMKKKRLIVSWI